MPTRAGERLVKAAEELFYAEGIRAVGVERLLDAAGIGRASFYRHFTSKDELVVEVLRAQDRRWRQWLQEAVIRHGGGPLAVFDALAERVAATNFRGCASINAMVELADPHSAGHEVAAGHKRAVIDYLDGLLRAAGRTDHAELAEQFMLLVDGAIVAALRERNAAPARRAKSMAGALLAQQPNSEEPAR